MSHNRSSTVAETEQTSTTHFDDTTRVRRVADPDGAGSVVFAADLDESWASLLGVHGGYVTSLAVRAAEAVLPGREVRTVAASFLRPTKAGPAEIVLDVIRSGRSFATVIARVLQGGRDVTNTRITMLTPVPGNEWSEPMLRRPAARDECVRFTPPPMIKHFGQADLLIDPATIPIGGADETRISGHVRPLEVRPFDAAWLTMIGDWFPPSPFRRFVPPTGGVSIDYAVHIHRTLPAAPDTWLEGVFEARTSSGGIALEHGMLATSDGVAVAETFHTRWTA
ncbi:MAG: TesB-like acyl-CoA thioesterase 3 [Ilumatobacteraceae bacterium]|nr:TesB-like acyl-CoA thioesterase 3 [Ilumatobacteraceae bacterium]